MKEIKKSASFKSKQKGKDVKFNIDLNYSPEYDSFIIKIKEGEGFMAYSSNIERMPLEVIQKLNEMLEEVLVQAGSKTEMVEDLEVELGAEPNPNHSLKSHEGSVKIKTYRLKVKSLSEAQNKVREFIEKNDLGSGNFTGGDLFSHGKKIGRVSYNGRVWNLKDESMKMFDGGNFQAGVYNKGGSLEAHGIKEGDTFLRTISGVIQKVKDKNGNIVYINLSNGERDSQPPLPFNKGGAIKNERLHVNKDEDYEVRYSKPRPHRKGYKGLRNFDGGGEMDLTDDKRLRLRKPVMPERKMSEQEWAEKHNPRAYEFMGKDKMMFGGDFLSNLKNIFTKDVTYKTDENGLFYVILKPLKEQRKYENIEDEVFFKFPENQLNKEDVGDFFVENSNVFLPNAQLSAEEIERKFGVKLSNKAKEIYTDKSKGLEKSKLEELIEQYNIAIKHRNYEKARKLLQEIDSERKSRNFATGGGVGLIGNQKRIDMNHNGKIDAEDFKLLRSSMNGAWRNERKHVNHNEDYEVRYSKPRPSRTGYKGKRNFEGGGGISKFKMLSNKVARNYEGKPVKPQYQKEYGKVYSKEEAKEVGNKVAGKVKSMQKAESGASVKKGGKGSIMTLAKQIRKDGESWQDALKRAGQQLK
jgi:hypothetical protein